MDLAMAGALTRLTWPWQREDSSRRKRVVREIRPVSLVARSPW